MLEFDDANLESVAKIVLHTNPHAADRWETVDNLVFSMRAMAAGSSSKDLGFVSTAGYMLTFFKTSGDKIGVRASVTDYNIMKYLEKVGVAL